MIYFIGEEFLKQDNKGYSIADYVASELGMNYEAFLDVESLTGLEKFNIIISSKTYDNKLNEISIQYRSHLLTVDFSLDSIEEASYKILDSLLENLEDDYEYLVQVYDTLQNKEYYNIYDPIFEKYLTEGKFLELGSGSGLVTEKLAKYNLDILATDLNERFLNELNNKNLNIKTKPLNIIHLDEEKNSEEYNYIGMFLDTLNYIPLKNTESVFKEANRLLKPGGDFIFDIHKEEQINIFNGYIEEFLFADFRFHWLSKKEEEGIVSHNFLFINENIKAEKHIQYIKPLEYYQKIYLPYFKEVEIIEEDDRWIIVLQKS